MNPFYCSTMVSSPSLGVEGGGVEKKKRTVQKLTNGDRKWICQRKRDHPSEKFSDMVTAFRYERNPEIELKSGTVSGILKQSDKWLGIPDGQESGARTRSSKEPELETALYAWRQEMLRIGEKVRDEDLRRKARELATAMGINTDRSNKGLSFSSGWLDRFKKRNGIKQTSYNRHRPPQIEMDSQNDFQKKALEFQAQMLSALQGAFIPDGNSLPTSAQEMLNASLPAGLDSYTNMTNYNLPPANPHFGVRQDTPSIPQPAPVASAHSPGVPQPDETFPLPQPASLPQPAPQDIRDRMPMPTADMLQQLAAAVAEHSVGALQQPQPLPAATQAAVDHVLPQMAHPPPPLMPQDQSQMLQSAPAPGPESLILPPAAVPHPQHGHQQEFHSQMGQPPAGQFDPQVGPGGAAPEGIPN